MQRLSRVVLVGLVLLAGTFPVFGQEECFAQFITYTSDGLRITGVIMKPPGDGPFPAVIFNHGSRIQYEREPTMRAGGRCTHVVETERWVYLVPDRRGYGSSEGRQLSTVLRGLSGEALGRATIERLWQEAKDVVNGMAFLKTLPYVDPGRIAVVGISHGGVVSLFAAAEMPDEFKAVVYQAGGIGGGIFAEIGLREMVRAGSRVNAPILIQHGQNDMLVPVGVSIALGRELARMGKDVTLRVYPGSHYIFDRQPVGEWGRDLVEFLHVRFGQ